MVHRLGVFMLVLLVPSLCLAEIQTTAIPYQHGDVPLEGFLAWDDARTGKRPGVLVVHEWWGLNEYAPRPGQATRSTRVRGLGRGHVRKRPGHHPSGPGSNLDEAGPG